MNLKGDHIRAQRNPTIDILKAFAIILVVLGHCIQIGSGQEYSCNEAYFGNLLFKIIYSFHMPLFMLISGYLFAFSASKGGFLTIAIKKVKTIAIPTLMWSVIIFAIDCYGSFLTDSPFALLKDFAVTALVSFWFLWAVLALSLFAAFVRCFLKDRYVVYILVFAALLLIPDFSITGLIKFMYPYFVVGYFFGKMKTTDNEHYEAQCKKLFGLPGMLIYGALFVVLIAFYQYDSFIYTSGIYILKDNVLRQLGIDVYRFVIGFVGSMLVISVIRAISSRINCGLLQAIGRNTMGIYIISVFINYFILPRLTENAAGAGILTAAETIGVIALCMGCIHIIKLSRLLNRVLFGGR